MKTLKTKLPTTTAVAPLVAVLIAA